MFKELTVAVSLTLIFSFGVGILFVKTILELLELVFNHEIEIKGTHKNKEGIRI